MFDFSRTAVHLPVHFQDALTLKSGGAECLDSYVSVSALPRTMSRARVVHNQPFFIGVAGGTASGKTTVCDHIMQRLHDQCVVMLCQDSFYRGLSPEELKNVSTYNFDDPGAFDVAEMVRCLSALKEMKAVDVPTYDFVHHRRSEKRRRVEPADVVIVEGILVLYMEEIRNLLNMKIYVDTDDDVRLARRIQRDVSVRGRDVAGVIQQYTSFVKPSFDSFVAPSRKHADVVIPWARDENVVAIDLITEHIKMKLQQPDLRRIYPNLEVIPSNFQIRGMHTIIRDRNTQTADFVFYADRLLRLVVEAGLGFLPFSEKIVTTPTGHTYVGVDFAKKLCGVSIIRSGESMENALRACCKGIKIGKILVHRHPKNREFEAYASHVYHVVADSVSGGSPAPPSSSPSKGRSAYSAAPASNQLPNGRASTNGHGLANGCGPGKANGAHTTANGHAHGSQNGEWLENGAAGFHARLAGPDEELVYEKLPKDIAERHVLLMDPILGAGSSAVRAIQVLLSKGVDEAKILFLTLIAAPEGIHNICGRFPRLKLITSEIDEGVDEHMLQVVPGVGEFGDRYFCE
eukprot:jgi/Botrbrau1/1714/Bobra.116_2s0056.1